MKTFLLLFAMLSIGSILCSQSIITGSVNDVDGKAVALANVYLRDSYEGTITDENGSFSFSTTAKGSVVFVVTAAGKKQFEKILQINRDTVSIFAILQSQIIQLGDIVVTAGAFEASDKKRGVQLRSLDIVTTAGGGGDIYGALQTLPGVTPGNSESGLFVRGGAASESKTIIDGMMVANPFFGDAPDIPARARFSAFGFTGMVFSSGGYSAEYGQALSSVLLLTSANNLEENARSISLSAASVSASTTTIIKSKKAFYADASISNLRPLFSIVPQNRDWQTPPKGYGTTLAYVFDNDSGSSLRVQARYQRNQLALALPAATNGPNGTYFSNQTTNQTIYGAYSRPLSGGWKLFTGVSFQHDDQRRVMNSDKLPQKDFFIQARSTISKRLNQKISLKGGIEWQHQKYESTSPQWQLEFRNNYIAAFAESDNRIARRFMVRAGTRIETSFLNRNIRLSPRLVIVYKAGRNSQVSAAYGHFYQDPSKPVLVQSNRLDDEKAVHYLVNYQYLTPKYTFRLEAYYKRYENLVTYSGHNGNLHDFDNGGYGYAKGVDLFIRDNKSGIKNLDYWISYSYVRSQRIFRNLPFIATPSFAPDHTLNLVTKYELEKIRSRISLTYTFSSSKDFYNPITFERFGTNTFQNVSLSCSHITSVLKRFAVVYLSISNLLNIRNVINYRFSDDGQHVQQIVPSAFRSFYIGSTIRF